MSVFAFTVCCLVLPVYSVWCRSGPLILLCGVDNFNKIQSAYGQHKFNAQGEEEVSIHTSI